MWVMEKKIKGREYLYLYKSVWENGKPRNKFVRYIGPKEKIPTEEVKRMVKESEDNNNSVRGAQVTN